MEFCLKNRARVEKGLGDGATLADIQLELKKEWVELHPESKGKPIEEIGIAK